MQCNESPTLKVVDDVRIHDAMAKYDCEITGDGNACTQSNVK